MITKAKKTSTKSKRTRNYATVIYPESAPEDWKEKLTELHVPCLISPLHDRDINPDKTPKKPHIHVMLMFDSVKTVEQVKALLQPIGAVGCESISSVRGYARYLCHLDNPEKYQYSQLDVQELNGSDYIAITELASDRRATGQEIRKFCREYGIVSFSSLIEYADEYREDWIAYLEKSGWLIKEYLKSKAWSIEHGTEVDIKKILDGQMKAADK